MKIGIIGAGAIGGFLGARLAASGHRVSMLARGDTLRALTTHGLRLDSGGASQVVQVVASADPRDLGPQDLLLLAVKAPALSDVAAAAAAMCSGSTIVAPALNGLPWWFFLGQQGAPLAGRRIHAADPLGTVEAAIPTPSLLGCVVFPACSVAAPGHVVHASGNRLVFGEPAGGTSERARAIAGVFAEAGFEAEASADVRRDVWMKLLGNACFNPVSMITRAHTDELIDDPAVHALFVAMMSETLAVGRAIGIDVAIDPRDRLAMTRRLGHIRTSMLQDAIAGRTVELDAILGALVEVAREAGVDTPMLNAVAALGRAHARQHGLLPGEH
jgi:2-dehydropantoate 2-reductase